MSKKVETMKLKGKDYATVPARIEAFRVENPEAVIETSYEMIGDHCMFKAFVCPIVNDDKARRATGHSFGKVIDEKAVEKLETVAVGRALAMLGYMANGQIASNEEMEEWEKYQSSKGTPTRQDHKPTEICATCGEPAKYQEGITKTGKPYKAIFCSSKDSTHTTWK